MPVPQSPYHSLSSLDYRYWNEHVAHFLSEEAFTRYKLRVEQALLHQLWSRGLCPIEYVEAVKQACGSITTAEVYQEEARVRHDIRALVNCIRNRVGDEIKPFVHLTATSYDIIETARALQYQEAMERVLLPACLELERELVSMTLREAETVQIGRTHGQHAVPITFGFAVAQFVSRFGGCILEIRRTSDALAGKFSGATGSFNASSLLFDDPEVFESDILAKLGIKPAEISTQIAPPEPLERLLAECVRTGGVLANLARNLRHLQRTEIGEVGEEFVETQVGSSAMPQKRNPINFENVESLWKKIIGCMVTVMLDQISEHERDLTNSASSRSYPEIIGYLVEMIVRITRTLKKLRVDKANMERNLLLTGDLILAEAISTLLSAQGHPDGHEYVRKLTLQAEQEKLSLMDLAMGRLDLQPYFEKLSDRQRKSLLATRNYTGIAAQKARRVAQRWSEVLCLS